MKYDCMEEFIPEHISLKNVKGKYGCFKINLLENINKDIPYVFRNISKILFWKNIDPFFYFTANHSVGFSFDNPLYMELSKKNISIFKHQDSSFLKTESHQNLSFDVNKNLTVGEIKTYYESFVKKFEIQEQKKPPIGTIKSILFAGGLSYLEEILNANSNNFLNVNSGRVFPSKNHYLAYEKGISDFQKKLEEKNIIFLREIGILEKCKEIEKIMNAKS
jgi:hypothetical protein